MKRSYKLQEFVAHASNVNCLHIGRRSGGVLATGGDDKQVNLWAIGKPHALVVRTRAERVRAWRAYVPDTLCRRAERLPPCLRAEPHRPRLARGVRRLRRGRGGGSGGRCGRHSEDVGPGAGERRERSPASPRAHPLQLLQLTRVVALPVVRTLTGHRAHCVAVDWHPDGEFFASGSRDTTLRVWDVRKRGCVHAYQGHTRAVTRVAFSPDGRWVVSGGQDGAVKARRRALCAFVHSAHTQRASPPAAVGPGRRKSAARLPVTRGRGDSRGVRPPTGGGGVDASPCAYPPPLNNAQVPPPRVPARHRGGRARRLRVGPRDVCFRAARRVRARGGSHCGRPPPASPSAIHSSHL